MKIGIFLFVTFIFPQLCFSNSKYSGKYLCNDTQILEIINNNLTIGNAVFEYYQSYKKPHGIIDVFIKGNEAATIINQPNWKGHYSLNIRNLKNNNEPPYVGDCIKVK